MVSSLMFIDYDPFQGRSYDARVKADSGLAVTWPMTKRR